MLFLLGSCTSKPNASISLVPDTKSSDNAGTASVPKLSAQNDISFVPNTDSNKMFSESILQLLDAENRLVK